MFHFLYLLVFDMCWLLYLIWGLYVSQSIIDQMGFEAKTSLYWGLLDSFHCQTCADFPFPSFYDPELYAKMTSIVVI